LLQEIGAIQKDSVNPSQTEESNYERV